MDKAKEISKQLRKLIDVPEEKRAMFFKTGKGDYAEHDRFLGLKVPTVRKVAKEHQGILLKDTQVLLDSKYNEERMLGLFILVHKFKGNEEKIYKFYMKNLASVNNWNLVDLSAHLIVGEYLLDKDKSILLKLARSKEMWERRVAIVSTWQFIRNNEFAWTLKLAKELINDTHDLIHKATGWMLRELGKRDETKLLSYLDQWASTMPRTSLRYSIERLSPKQKKHYMQL